MEGPKVLDRHGRQKGSDDLRDAENRHAAAVVAFERTWPALQAGPLADVAEEFIGWLAAQGYAATTQVNLSRAAIRLGTWMSTQNLQLGDLDQTRAVAMVQDDNDRYPEHCSANQNFSAVLRFLIDTGHLKVASTVQDQLLPAEVCLAAWLQYLEVEQGQGSSWLDKARKVGESFFRLIEAPSGDLVWERVTVAMTNDFVQRAISGYSSSTAQSTVALVRSLLSWAAENGWVSTELPSGILTARRIRSDPPKGLSTREVTALKNAIDPHSRTGKRDLAVIVMLARLGVRAGEVAGLTLEDINWQEPALRVVGKGGRILILPIPVDVGETLVDYLRVRTAEPGERAVFIRSLPPFKALNRVGITEIVYKHARIAGLTGIYAHRLRHTAATQILAKGGNLREVQELLGHSSLASSLTYARVDMVPLRPLAPPWGKLP